MTSNITDCTKDYIWPFTLLMPIIYDKLNTTYKYENCEIRKRKHNRYYYMAVVGVIVVMLVALAIWICVDLCICCRRRKNKRRITAEQLIRAHNEAEADQDMNETDTNDKDRLFETQSDEWLHSKTDSQTSVRSDHQLAVATSRLTTNSIQVNYSPSKLKLLKRRLEISEFYRRLLIHEMAKKRKEEESSIVQIGNFFRNIVNQLFGDPHTGLDFTDPQVMFYPYWPQNKDYSVLTAYGAVREHMMQDINLFAPPPPQPQPTHFPY